MSEKRMGAAAVIFDSEGQVLLVRHSYGKNNWELPGGKSEKDESAQETAQREVMEETGLEVNVGQLTGVYYDPNYDMHHFVFIAAINPGQEAKPSSPEILECRYCSLDDLPKPISDFTLRRIQETIEMNPKCIFHVIGPRKWIE
ncbi:NUDIX domain-containing protein [Paenibacillus dokdonensis]|uniref:NUDIX domain-containing protein n=1 Tax=Paenibacillus dokdonensis TaxID=2567944 RepID=A0ABU6GH40_9BACL|nr:NUDIX domain-containing protein [Paenibacillus dokdonensis]MEC0238437.1 NUDIX domain-containing protein [Paenibacillus dokdonensis]